MSNLAIGMIVKSSCDIKSNLYSYNHNSLFCIEQVYDQDWLLVRSLDRPRDCFMISPFEYELLSPLELLAISEKLDVW